MKILKKQNIFQVEDWSGNYPLLTRPYCVACYPTATRDGGNSIWHTVGSPIRVAFIFGSLSEAETCFAALTAGTKKIKDFTANVDDPRPLAWID